MAIEFCDTADGNERLPQVRRLRHRRRGDPAPPVLQPQLVHQDRRPDRRPSWCARSSPTSSQNRTPTLLRQACRMAQIGYGRVDYSLLDGRPQIWEINHTPEPSSPIARRASTCARRCTSASPSLFLLLWIAWKDHELTGEIGEPAGRLLRQRKESSGGRRVLRRRPDQRGAARGAGRLGVLPGRRHHLYAGRAPGAARHRQGGADRDALGQRAVRQLLAERVRRNLGATWGLAETGAAGPAGNRYGDAPGHACIAVAGPVSAVITLETGSADREANMWAFAKRARRAARVLPCRGIATAA